MCALFQSFIITMAAKEVVDKFYFDVKEPCSYGGFSRFASKFSHVGKKELKQYLEGEDAFTLHKPVRKKFPTRKTVAPSLDNVWQLDLTEMVKYSVYNDDVKYILFVIDVYSRYLWLKPLKDKKSKTVAIAVREIIEEDGRYPQMMWTDKGAEFLGQEFQDIVMEYSILYYNTFSVNKAAVVERVQRTIKERMHRYFTKMNTFKYIDILQDLAYSYNRSFHRIIKTTPLDMVKSKPAVPKRKIQKIKIIQALKYMIMLECLELMKTFGKDMKQGGQERFLKLSILESFLVMV